MDDHSSDNAIGQLAQTDSRIKILESTGTGVVRAFNQGMHASKGLFVARMDADDIALPQRLETQVNFLRDHPAIGICGACVEIFSTTGIQGGNARYQDWLNSVRTAEQVHRELFIESPIPNPGAMFRRDVLIGLGGYREVDWPEDYDLFLRADQAGIRMAKPEPILLRWREHKNRLTHIDPQCRRGKPVLRLPRAGTGCATNISTGIRL